MAARDKKQINLLPQEEFEASTLGRVLKWLTSTFRAIVILSELVVMIAFLSRFYFDARITDLNDEIKVQRATIEAFASFEELYRKTQEKLRIFTAITPEERQIIPTLQEVSSFLPDGVRLTSFSLIGEEVTIKASSLLEESISQFIVNLESAQKYQDIALSQIETEEDGSSIGFTLKAKL